MKPVHICGSDDAIVIGRTRFGGYALRNVTRTIRTRTLPKLKQQMALARAAYGSFGQPWAVLVANVASQASGSKGGMSLGERRSAEHTKAGGRIASMQSQIASLEGHRGVRPAFGTPMI
jgi:hypothetical protein